MKVVLLMFLAGTMSAQSGQLVQVPPKPTCMPGALPLFGGGPDCQDRWNLYNQAVQQRARQELQNYVDRQKELASSQATAPLQQQIADLQKLSNDEQAQIKKLTEQMEADAQTKADDAKAAAQAKTDAHKEGLEQGAGAVLAIVAVIFGIRKLASNFTISSKKQARAASA